MITRAIDAALDAARHRAAHPYFVGVLELYCPYSGCPVRTVTVDVKEHDTLTPADLRCPACRRRLKLHWVRTLDEDEKEAQRESRRSVNAQLYEARYRREHPDASVILVPLGAFCDERLPGPVER